MQYSMRRVMHRLLASDRAEYEYNSSLRLACGVGYTDTSDV